MDNGSENIVSRYEVDASQAIREMGASHAAATQLRFATEELDASTKRYARDSQAVVAPMGAATQAARVQELALAQLNREQQRSQVKGLVLDIKGDDVGKRLAEIDRLQSSVTRLTRAYGDNHPAVMQAKQALIDYAPHLDDVSKRTGNLNTQLTQSIRGFVTGALNLSLLAGGFVLAGRAVADFVVGSVQDFRSLEEELLNIKSIKPEIDTSKLFQQLGEISTRVPKVSQELAQGAYNIASSIELPQDKLIELTEKTSKGAVAARTDTQQWAGAVIGTMSAYGKTLDDVDHIQDLFFQGVRDGVITGQQLSTAMGPLAQNAKLAGVSIEELTAELIISTKQGGNALENANDLANFYQHFTTKEAQKALNDIGVQTVDQNGQFRNQIDILRELQAALDGMTDSQRTTAIQKIFPDVQAQRGLNRLLTDLDGLDAKIKQTTTEVGTMGKAFDTQMEASANKTRLLAAEWERLRQQIGGAGNDFIAFVGGSIGQALNFQQEFAERFGLTIKEMQAAVKEATGKDIGTAQILTFSDTDWAKAILALTQLQTKHEEVKRDVDRSVSAMSDIWSQGGADVGHSMDVMAQRAKDSTSVARSAYENFQNSLKGSTQEVVDDLRKQDSQTRGSYDGVLRQLTSAKTGWEKYLQAVQSVGGAAASQTVENARKEIEALDQLIGKITELGSKAGLASTNTEEVRRKYGEVAGGAGFRAGERDSTYDAAYDQQIENNRRQRAEMEAQAATTSRDTASATQRLALARANQTLAQSEAKIADERAKALEAQAKQALADAKESGSAVLLAAANQRVAEAAELRANATVKQREADVAGAQVALASAQVAQAGNSQSAALSERVAAAQQNLTSKQVALSSAQAQAARASADATLAGARATDIAAQATERYAAQITRLTELDRQLEQAERRRLAPIKADWDRARTGLESYTQASEERLHDLDERLYQLSLRFRQLEKDQALALKPLADNAEAARQKVEDLRKETEAMDNRFDVQAHSISQRLYPLQQQYQAQQDQLRGIGEKYSVINRLQAELNRLHAEDAALSHQKQLDDERLTAANLAAQLGQLTAGSAEWLSVQQQLSQQQEETARHEKEFSLEERIAELQAAKEAEEETLRSQMAVTEQRMQAIEREQALLEHRRQEYDYEQRQKEIAAQADSDDADKKLSDLQKVQAADRERSQGAIDDLRAEREAKAHDDAEEERRLATIARWYELYYGSVKGYYDDLHTKVGEQISDLQALQTEAENTAKAGKTLGTSLIEGMAQGVTEGQGALADAVVLAVLAAIEAGKVAVEANSPSQRSGREIGLPIVQGVGEYIERYTPLAIRRMEEMTDRLMASAKASIHSIGDVTASAAEEWAQGASGLLERERLATQRMADDLMSRPRRSFGDSNLGLGAGRDMGRPGDVVAGGPSTVDLGRWPGIGSTGETFGRGPGGATDGWSRPSDRTLPAGFAMPMQAAGTHIGQASINLQLNLSPDLIRGDPTRPETWAPVMDAIITAMDYKQGLRGF